jgi:hypothetical protein
MPFDVSIQRTEHYIGFAWSGHPNYDDVLDAWRRVFATLHDAGMSRALVELSYQSTLDASDAFRTMEAIIADARRFGVIDDLKIARVFLAPHSKEAHEFSENVGVNRGLNLKTFFGDTDSAIEWLTAP